MSAVDPRQKEIIQELWNRRDSLPEDKRQIVNELGSRVGLKDVSPTLLASRQAASKSEFEANKPESTIGSRTREAAIGVLEPFTAGTLSDTAGSTLGALYDMVTGAGSGKAQELLKGAVTAPIQPVKEFIQGAREGDYDRIAYGAGGITSQTVPAVAGAVDTARSGVGMLRDTTRQAAQALTGSGAAKTTTPLVDRFAKSSELRARAQELANKATDASNRIAQEKAAAKNATSGAEFDASETAKNAEFKKNAADVLAANRESVQSASRVQGLERSMQEGSKRLGESVKDLDAQLRSEANERYDTVKQAVAEDPGVPLSDLAEAARHAETNILKGSAENIKQFRELARKVPEQEGIQTNVGEVGPGDPLYEMLKSQGAIDTGGNLPFDQLQGYSSEIGRKLAQGNLPGDVYQALKYLKNKIDAAKTVIADRNGAGAALRNADSFWHDYQDLMYDKESPLTKVRESVGTVDPQFYADPLVKGKSFEVAIGKLKSLKTNYSGDQAKAVANLAKNIRDAGTEMEGIKVAKLREVPTPPKPGEKPSGVISEVRQPKVIEQPRAPTAEEIVDAKRRQVMQKGASFQELNRRDIAVVATPFILGILGHDWVTGLTAGVGMEGVVKGIGAALTRPKIVNWIAQPVAADLAAIDRLPPAARAELGGKLRAIIDQENAKKGRVVIDPAVNRLISNTGVIGAAPVRDRREALELLGR